MTIRALVKQAQSEIQKNPDLLPDRAAELLNLLSSLLGNISDEIRNADMEYAKVLLAALESEEKANRARIKAEISPEYQRKREARDTRELAIELMRSLKYFIKVKQDEYQQTR